MEYKREKARTGIQKISAPKYREPSIFNAATLGNQGMLGLLQSPVQRVITDKGNLLEDRDTFLEEAMEQLRVEMSDLLQENGRNETFTPELENLARSIFERRFDDEESFDFMETVFQVADYIINKLEGKAMVLDVPQIPRDLNRATGTAEFSIPTTIARANILYRSMSVSEFLTVARNRTLSSSGSFYSPYIEYSRRYLTKDQQILAAFYFDDTIGNLLRGSIVKFQNSSDYFRSDFAAGPSSQYQLKTEVPTSGQTRSFKKNRTLRGINPPQIKGAVENIQLGDRGDTPPEKRSPLILQDKGAQFQHWAIPELSDHLVAVSVEDLFEPDNIRGKLAPFIEKRERLQDVWDMGAQSAYPEIALRHTPTDEAFSEHMPERELYVGGHLQFNPAEPGIGRDGRCFWDSLELILGREYVQMAAENAGMVYGNYVVLDLIEEFINRYNGISNVEPIAIMLYMFHYGETNSYGSMLIGQRQHKIINLGYLHVKGQPDGHFVPPAGTH